MAIKITFLGASQQVTGSRYYLEAAGLKLLIDCGMFQERQYLARNWAPFPFDPQQLNGVILTHAHLDHVGTLPRLIAQGYKKPILMTEPTVELATLIMLDSARIQEEDARYKRKRHKKSGHKAPHPVTPLYTTEEAQHTVPLLKGFEYNTPLTLNDHVQLTFLEAGHILGPASLLFEINDGGQIRKLVFSGDIGQNDKPLISDPAKIDTADIVIMESTYGDRNHKEHGPVVDQLETIINDTYKRGGNLVIPTFAVERAQELMYHISELVYADLIPDIPVFMDSPMAVDVTEIFKRYRSYMDQETIKLFQEYEPPLRFPGLSLVRSVEDSKAIKQHKGTAIIMSSSGMCTGGRIKHHLKNNITNPNNTILFVGYQANGTLGQHILRGAKEVRIHGQRWPVNANIAQIQGFSGHGDQEDLINWLGNMNPKPKHVILTHGEADSAKALTQSINAKWQDISIKNPGYQTTLEF
ncbi:MAG: MBL fold metallo-hydrolase [Phycisphaeraceae bacterium]|nr:MBL fold metallo-hydrolase [Phycisphaeraceae bacterium]